MRSGGRSGVESQLTSAISPTRQGPVQPGIPGRPARANRRAMPAARSDSHPCTAAFPRCPQAGRSPACLLTPQHAGPLGLLPSDSLSGLPLQGGTIFAQTAQASLRPVPTRCYYRSHSNNQPSFPCSSSPCLLPLPRSLDWFVQTELLVAVGAPQQAGERVVGKLFEAVEWFERTVLGWTLPGDEEAEDSTSKVYEVLQNYTPPEAAYTFAQLKWVAVGLGGRGGGGRKGGRKGWQFMREYGSG